jgi:Asp-tRNA(Asn)/Glu-tRNA(Gln) amidotransferase A subunit family amidase
MQTATQILDSIRSGLTSQQDAVEACLAAIDKLDGEIEAWVEVDRKNAVQRAKELSGQAPTAPLHGLPVGIKDIIDVAGLPTRLGAPAFAHYVAERDAAAVARLRAAGAIPLGKTATTQFAYMDPAPTRNPWNQDHTPGGSSSGSAAAVASGQVPLALGTQTVGSVLRPAAYCGIVGLKPSFGRISYAGANSLAPSFDHVGVLSPSVADAALALDVLAGFDPADPFSADVAVQDYVAAARSRGTQPRIGLARHFYEDAAGDEVAHHVTEVAERLRKAGAEVHEIQMPATPREIADLGQPVLRAEAAAVHSPRFERHGDEYAPNIRALIEAGKAVTAVDYIAAKAACRELRDRLTERLRGFDAIMMPVSPTTAPEGLASTGNSIFCAPASFSGLPSIALPSGIGTGGLPLSVQLVSAPFGETTLLSAAAWVEDILAFNARPAIAAA